MDGRSDWKQIDLFTFLAHKHSIFSRTVCEVCRDVNSNLFIAVRFETFYFSSSQVRRRWKPHTLKTPEIGPRRQRGHENRGVWRRERVRGRVRGVMFKGGRVTSDVTARHPEGRGED